VAGTDFASRVIAKRGILNEFFYFSDKVGGGTLDNPYLAYVTCNSARYEYYRALKMAYAKAEICYTLYFCRESLFLFHFFSFLFAFCKLKFAFLQYKIR
jgi:hypothetical protein